MLIKEIITERKKGKLHGSVKLAMHKTHTYTDGHNTNGVMNFYRVGMAAAMADGSNKPIDIDERTWYSTDNVTVPYSDIENKMMTQAFRAIKTKVKTPVSVHASKESKTVNVKSPVAPKKKNQYGF